MTTASYSLPTLPQVIQHGTESVPRWLGDFAADASEADNNREYNSLDAMAASGDYFITLVTRLDKVAQGLPQDSAEQIEIEHLITTLFYMQDNYDLVAKRKRP